MILVNGCWTFRDTFMAGTPTTPHAEKSSDLQSPYTHTRQRRHLPSHTLKVDSKIIRRHETIRIEGKHIPTSHIHRASLTILTGIIACSPCLLPA